MYCRREIQCKEARCWYNVYCSDGVLWGRGVGGGGKAKSSCATGKARRNSEEGGRKNEDDVDGRKREEGNKAEEPPSYHAAKGRGAVFVSLRQRHSSHKSGESVGFSGGVRQCSET